MFELGINAGPRVSELIDLDVGQVLQYGAMVEQLELYETKGHRPRRVPLNRWTRSCLEAFIAWKELHDEPLDPEAPLFLNMKGGRLTRYGADWLLHRIYRDCKLAGKVTTHSLRKTFATALHRGGVPVKVIQELLGHANLNTTEAYIEITEADKIAAVEVLEPDHELHKRTLLWSNNQRR